MELEKQLEKVMNDPYEIRYIENPSLEVQLESVRINGNSIIVINDPPLEVQLEAVRQNGCAIKFIDNPPLEVELEAIRQSIGALAYIKDITPEIQLEVVRKNKIFIRGIRKRLDLSNESLLETHIDVLEALIIHNCISDESLEYLAKNGNKDIRRIIMEYKLSK